MYVGSQGGGAGKGPDGLYPFLT